MVTETNRYAHQRLDALERRGLLAPQSRFRKWVDVTVEEMKRFIAILLSMGITRRKNLADYWSTNPNLYIPYFSRNMSFKRFELITSMFHLSSIVSPPAGQPGYDPWAKIREFIDQLNDSFKAYFVPAQQVCIDESMVGMKNRTTFIQYMPNKRHSRFGIKKFELCDSATGYVMQSVLYSGKYFLSMGSDPFTHKVVAYLLGKAALLDKGYHLFTDNFYTKIRLARWLSDRNTFLTGTVNKRSKELSTAVLGASLEVGEALYYRMRLEPTGSVLFVKYRERATRKPVHLITTAIHAQNTESTSASGRKSTKPLVIQVYNKHMGGVDLKDKSVYHLSCTRTSIKYWRKIVYNFTDMAMLNAYLLYKCQHSDKPMPRSKFVGSIIDQLSFANAAPPPLPIAGPTGDIPGPHDIGKLPNRNNRECVVCMEKHGLRRRTSFWCPTCNVGVHPLCNVSMDHNPELYRRRHGRKPTQ
ncbi:piggyBac transposable element-derived protein 4-like [Macrosteles quadrilineatus]|uniref:piggyBac transposable element-derived protein 4-like n=1 Tax=Macrosteles quadrilineatus TaxID=74068 RepID=UPI0023E26D70|nr:piggyBac transposable element-derived protein 4-like [Macrosteles quadrilineatus]